MAGDGLPRDAESGWPVDLIGRLRAIAEKHVQEIDEDKLQEEKDELKRKQDIEHYAKRKKQEKHESSIISIDVPIPKMRSAQDVLKRLQWDTDLDMSKYVIGYLERFAGIKEIPARKWLSEVTEEEWIPQHRIKYFKRLSENGEDEIVWDREKRIDKIFGTGWKVSSSEDDEKADIRSTDGGVSLLPR
ncbi:poly(A) polymerase [Fonsecaea erecta]|uniref:Poly(A) polymerase n=1 Tax=Fonsecaea erecta TaxID=1367422 RepID=A0A178ZYS1_9EURO|nr:poly(A) polymerase [Fonsecaea erecta]OAP64461.1 poly(A) polymerase [Fonsecaea erecta]